MNTAPSLDERAVDPRRRALRGCFGALLALAAFASARPATAARTGLLRILCSGPVGSIPDLVARIVGDQWPASSDQRAIVENRPGAAGQISVGALKAAPAGGSVLLLAQGAIATVYPYLYSRLGYDAAADLRPVSMASEMSLALAVGPAVPPEVSTLANFMDWVRRHPGDANVGSPGTGTLPHLLEAMLFGEAGLAWQHVAYPGGPPAVNALLGGQIAALALPEGLLRQHHASRRIRVLATSGPTRSSYLPEVPSFVEQGHPNLVVKEWFAFFAPGGAARDVVAAASQTLREAIGRPEVAAAFAESGMTPTSSSPEALSARIAVEQRFWQPVLRTYRIQAD